MSPDEMREWYAEYLDVCNRHDLAAIRGLLAPDVRRAHLPSGADAWIAGLEEVFHGFPDYRWKRVAVIVEGDRIAAHLRASGTHSGAYRLIPPTGRHVNVAEFAMYRLAEGRIVEYAGTADDLELLAQLGATR